MLENLQEYKFIVSSGCSYGRLPDFVFNPFSHIMNDKLYSQYNEDWLLTNNEKVISINAALSSQGSDWQSDSVIYIIRKLLELGVKNENIFCLIEWSQWHRLVVHSLNVFDLDLTPFDFKRYDDCYQIVVPGNMFKTSRDFVLQLSNNFNVYSSNLIHNVGKIGDRVYFNPRHTHQEAVRKLGINYKLFHNMVIEIENKVPIENKLKTYFDNILRTQYFLENNYINYNFLCMQATFSEWFKNNEGVLYNNLYNNIEHVMFFENNRMIFNKNYNPINNINNDIEKVMPELKDKFDELNLSNFWFYENQRYRRGGIDEFTIDNLKETGYIFLDNDRLKHKNLNGLDIKATYNEHPNIMAYILLWNQVAKNCPFLKIKDNFLDFMVSKYWEDYHHNDFTKNAITISRAAWYKIAGLDNSALYDDKII